MRMRQLIFPIGMWDKCRELLFTEDGSENFLMGVSRPCRRGGGLAYTVEQILDFNLNSYVQRGHAGVTLTGESSSRVNLVCLEAGKASLVPVHLHSHPFGCSDFSSYDDAHEDRLHKWLADNGQPLLWSLVWPYRGDPVARLWSGGRPHAGFVRAGLQPLDIDPVVDLPALDRQRVFGRGFQKAAATLRVGLVGLGGVGIAVAEQLARCGFRYFLLIDPDQVEITNLNRLPGTTLKDIGRTKVNVARRLIRQGARAIGTDLYVRTIRQDIYAASRRTRSLLRQCDIVLALTDDELSRITCLQIALEGGAEYIQAGVDIRLSDNGEITGLFVEITGAEVNRYCPICTGRLDPGQASLEARRYVGGEVWEHAQRQGYIPGIPAPSVMSLNYLVSGLLVSEIQRRVSGLGVRDLWQIDVQTASHRAFDHIEKDLDGECVVCGRGEVVAGWI